MLPKSVQNLINELSRLPGIGPKTAARLALFYVRSPKERALRLAELLSQSINEVKICSKCFNLTDTDPCKICSATDRNQAQLCVVEDPLDLLAFERAGVYQGLYFVLGGLISPVDGVGPHDLRLPQLTKRIQDLVKLQLSTDHSAPNIYNQGSSDPTDQESKRLPGHPLEVIIALNPSTEGETTAMYIKEDNKQAKSVYFSRLAIGLPTGADIDYADSNTLHMALAGRREL